ncbi:hypothetical protein MMC26_003944 [Xylographa opegraphella]|nr:hypothetical protein [Xylographa opegraphella]
MNRMDKRDKFSPIAEEPVAGLSSPRHENVLSPLLSGSQTASTESYSTVRGSAMPQTPGAVQVSTSSYPFPSMNVDNGTPLGTPALHKPFTALSPTVTPSPMKQAKGQTSRDFIAAGHLTPSSMRAFVPSNPSGMPDLAPSTIPNLYDVMLRVQSEPGLASFWTQVTQTMREHYGAERVILAVPSDVTDIENVPWVQLATYSTGEEDSVSRATTTANEPQSARSSVELNVKDRSGERQSSPTNTRNVMVPGSSSLSSRPRLESRHSYAGYPPKVQSATTELQSGGQLIARRPPASRTGSHLSLRGGRTADDTALRSIEFSAELSQHDTSESSRGPLSEVTYASSRLQLGRILSTPQSLEAEYDPLLTSAGVVRVLDRGRSVILTRDYPDASQSLEERREQMRQRSASGARNWPTAKSTAASTQIGTDQSEASTLKALKLGTRPAARPRSQTSESSHGSPVGQHSDDGLHRAAYDDYEQIPASPWSQSPAPSPAARADPEQNPFFVQGLIDEDSFAENPPPHIYANETPIQAIGVDRATSVVHVPLIHPTFSQPRRPQRLVDQRRAKLQGFSVEKAQHSKFIQPSLTSSSESSKRMPIAILSVLSSQNPYPTALAQSLDNLAPLLATAFYNARQHSVLENEVVTMSRRRQNLGSKGVALSKSGSHLMMSIATTAGFSFPENKDRGFSPTSTSSFTSEYSNAPPQSPRESVSGSSVAGTPGWSNYEPIGKPGKRQGQSPGIETQYAATKPRDYFSSRKPGVDSQQSEGPQIRTLTDSIKEPPKPKQSPKHSSDPTLPPPLKSPIMPPTTATEQPLEGLDYNFKEPSGAMLRTMIENGATQQFIAEPVSGTIIWANSKFQAYRNALVPEIYDHPWKNIHHDEQRAFRRLWEKALVSGDQVSLRVRLRRFDGEYRWFHMKILAQKDKHGVIQHWHGQAMDTHDQHVAEIRAAREKEKAASEAKYRALANSNPHSIFAASVPQGMTFANTQWLSYSGQTLEETLGFGFLDHVHPDDLIKCRFPGVDDPLDVEAVKALLSPRQSLARQHSTSSSSGETQSTSTAETERTLRPNQSIPGTPPPEVEAPSALLRALVKDRIIKCSRDGQDNLTITTEMRLKSKTGDYRWHLVQGSLIESVNFGQGDAQWFIACADITDQKLSEARLKQANDALEKEMSRKMEYLSSMSHEIRTPLNGILGNLQFLTNSGLDEHQQDWVFGAQKAAQGMHSLINDILDVSKAEAKMLKLSRQWFSVRSTMEEVMETLMSKATEKGLELCYEITDNVPSNVNGDSGRVKQILLNLVGNAIKFTRRGEVWVKCDVPDGEPANLPHQLAPNETLLQFSVKDTGSGFSAEDAKLLFKPYSQIDNNDNRNIGGTGLGLILCRTMVELHGGEIWAESVSGKGATFTFYARFFVRESTDPSVGSQSLGSTSSLGSASVLPSPAALPGYILKAGVFESPGTTPRFPISDQDSPALLSSGSSDPSSGSLSFHRSLRSSASTVDSVRDVIAMKLKLPSQLGPLGGSDDGSTPRPAHVSAQSASEDSGTMSPTGKAPIAIIEPEAFRPPMLSILIVCPQEHTRRTTQEHIQRVLPKSTPAQLTSEGNVGLSEKMMGGDDPVTFTHVILQLSSAAEVLTFMAQILDSTHHLRTCIVVVTDQAQRAAIVAGAPDHDYEKLSTNDRLKFILKPAKPHKFAKIFDPGQENAQSTDDQTRAELKEKQLLQRTSYAMFKQVLGNKGIRALAVEDNNLNMEILVNFLGRICCMDVTKAWDGEECLEKVFAHEPLYYSIIILLTANLQCDIEMPRMDGYTACRKIREWETKHNYPHVPMISLSANVMTKGWRESAEAGFTHYSMKPVEWRDLGHIIVDLLKPSEPHVFLRDRPLPEEILDQQEEAALEKQAREVEKEPRKKHSV